MKKNIIKVTAAFVLGCIFLTGCGSGKKDYYSEPAPAPSGDYYYESSSAFDDSDYAVSGTLGNSYSTDEKTESPVENDSVPEGLKIVYRSYFSIETLEYDESLKAIKEAVSACGGYIESSEEYGGVYYSSGYVSSKSLYLVARIPSDNYRDFIDKTGGFGSVTSRNESTENITSQYLDVAARLSALSAQEDRLLDLLSEADSIETILAIENQLSEVRYQIESYTSTMRTYENLLSYSTVTISLDEVKETTPTAPLSFGQRLISAVKNSCGDFVNFLEELVFFIIYALPYAVLVCAVIFVIKMCKKAYYKKHPEKFAEAEAKREAKRNRKNKKSPTSDPTNN